jgi:hypothetical protein
MLLLSLSFLEKCTEARLMKLHSHSLMFFKDSKIVILLENGQLHDAERKKNIKFKDFQKSVIRGLVGSDLC